MYSEKEQMPEKYSFFRHNNIATESAPPDTAAPIVSSYHLKIIVILTAADLPSSLCLNYSEFPNSYLLCQLSVRINLFDMFIDGGGVQHHTMPPSYSASTRYSYPHTGFHSWHRSHQWRLQKSDIPLPNLNSCREFTA